MRAWQGSVFARELIAGVIELPPHEFNWGRENLRRAVDRGAAVTIFPSPFFDTEWQADPKFEPFKRTANSANLYDGAFAWHWHNRWDRRIEDGCKFQRLEAAMDARLRAMGFAPGPAVGAHGE
jgi:hypothetical protein